MIKIDYHDTVAVLSLERDITNAINFEFIEELSRSLKKIKSNPDVNGLVLNSTNEKFFSIGFDIPQLYDLPKEDFRQFYKSFNQMCLDLYTLPNPTIAAIKGHAVAGGCILTLCCDYRFIAEGRKLMGLNEVKLGVPVPYLTDCMLQSIIDGRYAREIMESGDFYEPEKLLQIGMVDQIFPLADVLEKSLEKAKLLGSIQKEAYDTIKRNRVEIVEERVLKHWNNKQEIFVECWYSEKSRKQLKEAMEKF